jgi:two-component system chemotaxis response regulator CheY
LIKGVGGMPFKKKKVLIVDDSTLIFNSLKSILEASSFEVVGYAKDGFEAINKYKELTPDIITMDINMPRMDGIQALRILKSINENLKVVMVTSLNRLDKLVECKNAGASNYIIKPFEKEKVLDIFSSL